MDEIVDLVKFENYFRREQIPVFEKPILKRKKSISESIIPISERLQKKAFEQIAFITKPSDVPPPRKRGRPIGVISKKKDSFKNQKVVKESIEEKFVKKIKGRSHISYLKDVPVIFKKKFKCEYAYENEEGEDFDQNHICLPENTSEEIRNMTISFLKNARNFIPMTNESYDHLAKSLIPLIYQYWIDNHLTWNLTESHPEIGMKMMEMVHENDIFSRNVLQNVKLYATPFCYFMKLYFKYLHINEKIDSYIIPLDMEGYKDLLKKIKLFFPYTGNKAKHFGSGLIFHITILTLESPSIEYCSGGAPSQPTLIRETTVREIFQIKKNLSTISLNTLFFINLLLQT